MFDNLRAREEISILGSEAERYYKWISDRLDNCERALGIIGVDSAIEKEILEIGSKTVSALVRLEGIGKVRLNDDGKFKPVQETINCKSHVDTIVDSSNKSESTKKS